MQLTSLDKRTTIDISRAKGGGAHAPYKLRVQSGSGFLAENDAVHFLDIEDFRTRLETFLKNRQGSVTLHAGNDCELEFFRWNAKGDVGVRYIIGTQFMEGEAAEYSKIALSGRFRLHGEFAEGMAAQLLEVLSA